MFALFPQCGDTSGASLGVRSVALFHLRKVLFGRQGVESLFSRSSLGVLSVEIKQGIREEKRTAILINSTFGIWEFFGSSLVHPWFVLGL